MHFPIKTQKTIKYKFFMSVVFLTTLFTISSCSQGSGSSGSGGGNSQNTSANVINENPPPNTQNYLLIGAKGRGGKGAVFKCNLDGTQCAEFIGGNIPFISSEPTAKNIKLTKGDNFGSSISGNQNFIYIGSEGKSGQNQYYKPDSTSPNGTVYKCDLTGKNCIQFDTDTMKLITNDNFGSSLFATKDKIYIGAPGRDSGDTVPTMSPNYKDDIGAVFQYDLNGINASEFIAGKNQTSKIKSQLNRLDHLGTSIFVTNSNIFIGAKDKNGGNGAVFKCDLSGDNCVAYKTDNLNLITNDNFGVSLSGNGVNLFVGAIGRDSGSTSQSNLYDTGSIFKCDFNVGNCIAFLGGQNQDSRKQLDLSVNDNFGSSVIATSDSIYIGSMGRKTDADKRTGAVFKCNIDGSNCVELIAGKSKINTSDSLGLKEGDLFGSSITIVNLPISEASHVLNENCSDLKIIANDVINNTKVTLCNLLVDANKSNSSFVNAYSKMNATTIILNDSQGSLRQIDSKTGTYIGAGSVYEYWGVRDWISSNPNDAFNAHKKIVAFGELSNSIPQIGNIWKGIWDIRFVDEKGNILKANSLTMGTYSGHNANYSIEKAFDAIYVANVYAAFVINTNEKENLYFLKKDGNYDILDTEKYNVISNGKLNDLFNMLPPNEVNAINFIIKLNDKIALFRKINNNQFPGYYLISINDIIQNNAKAKVTYVQLAD
jgi:hypothetical protein